MEDAIPLAEGERSEYLASNYSDELHWKHRLHSHGLTYLFIERCGILKQGRMLSLMAVVEEERRKDPNKAEIVFRVGSVLDYQGVKALTHELHRQAYTVPKSKRVEKLNLELNRVDVMHVVAEGNNGQTAAPHHKCRSGQPR